MYMYTYIMYAIIMIMYTNIMNTNLMYIITLYIWYSVSNIIPTAETHKILSPSFSCLLISVMFSSMGPVTNRVFSFHLFKPRE